jgi:hypothetical protein
MAVGATEIRLTEIRWRFRSRETDHGRHVASVDVLSTALDSGRSSARHCPVSIDGAWRCGAAGGTSCCRDPRQTEVASRRFVERTKIDLVVHLRFRRILRALTIAGVHLHGRRPVLTPYVSDSAGRAQEGRSRSSRWKVSGVAKRDTVALWLGPTNCTSYVDATVLWVVGASHVPARSRPTVPDNGAPYDDTSPGPQMPSPPRPPPPPLRSVHSAIGRLVLLSSRMYTRIPSPISADATLRPQLSY